MVGYARRNFLVPVPSFESFAALNAHLERRCLKRMDAQLRGHTERIGQRMERDLEDLPPLPAAPYDACNQRAGRVSSLSPVRSRTRDYSAPVAYGHREVLIRGYVDQVVISCGSEVIARYLRFYQRDDFVFDPIHSLPLLEQKTGALDQAAPIQGWELPEEFATLRRLLAGWGMHARDGEIGKRLTPQHGAEVIIGGLRRIEEAAKSMGGINICLDKAESRRREQVSLDRLLNRIHTSVVSAGRHACLIFDEGREKLLKWAYRRLRVHNPVLRRENLGVNQVFSTLDRALNLQAFRRDPQGIVRR